MRKSQDVAAILLGIVLFLVVLGIIVVVTRSKNNPGTTANNLTPTPLVASPTQTAQNGNPPVVYNESSTDKLLAIIKKKDPLAATDRVAKANILTLLPSGKQSGIVYANDKVSIEYVQAPDLFMVEILTTDIPAAKSAANIWFRSHGISQQAICKMPVEFYINYDVASQLRGKSVNFSPLGNGC